MGGPCRADGRGGGIDIGRSVMTGAGGATKIGACGGQLGSCGTGAAGNGSAGPGTTAPVPGADGLTACWGFTMSLNRPVKPVAETLLPAGADDICCGGAACPNSAVNSPTFLRGGSIGSEAKPGTSAGLSPRNGPWKKLVNSPGFGPSFGGPAGISGTTGLTGSEKGSAPLSFGGVAALMLAGSEGAGACSPDSPARLICLAGGCGAGGALSDADLDFIRES